MIFKRKPKPPVSRARLRNLQIDRIDLVDKGANPMAHVVLAKRAPGGCLPGYFDIRKRETNMSRKHQHRAAIDGQLAKLRQPIAYMLDKAGPLDQFPASHPLHDLKAAFDKMGAQFEPSTDGEDRWDDVGDGSLPEMAGDGSRGVTKVLSLAQLKPHLKKLRDIIDSLSRATSGAYNEDVDQGADMIEGDNDLGEHPDAADLRDARDRMDGQPHSPQYRKRAMDTAMQFVRLRKRAGETDQQAFARLSQTDKDVQNCLRLYYDAPVDSDAPPVEKKITPVFEESSERRRIWRKLEDLADAHIAKSARRVSKHKALDLVMQTPAGKRILHEYNAAQ